MDCSPRCCHCSIAFHHSVIKNDKNSFIRLICALGMIAQMLVVSLFWTASLMASIGYAVACAMCLIISFHKVTGISKRSSLQMNYKPFLAISGICFALALVIPSLWTVLLVIIGLALYMHVLQRLNRSGESIFIKRITRAVASSIALIILAGIALIILGIIANQSKSRPELPVAGVLVVCLLYLVIQQYLVLLMTGYWVGDLCRPLSLLSTDVDSENANGESDNEV
jgi:hypothetical protein